MKIGIVQFDLTLFLGAAFRQEKLISDTLYAVAFKPGELLKERKLDRTGFTRGSSPIPHCWGHSHLATQPLPDPRQSLSGGKGIKTWPHLLMSLQSSVLP